MILDTKTKTQRTAHCRSAISIPKNKYIKFCGPELKLSNWKDLKTRIMHHKRTIGYSRDNIAILATTKNMYLYKFMYTC